MDDSGGTAASGQGAPSTHPGTARRVGLHSPHPAPETLRLYAADWSDFCHWCRQHGHSALPVVAEALGAYLLDAAPGLSRGALGRRKAAVAAMHRQHGLPVPRLGTATRAALRQAARPRATTQPKVKMSASGLVRLATGCARDLAGLRDRALLLLAAATSRPARTGISGAGTNGQGAAAENAGVPRSLLLGLDAEHIRFTASGAVLLLRLRSDDEEPSRSVTLTRAARPAACPVRALEDWLRASDTAYGPVFRKIDRWGNVEHARLGPTAWPRILARRGGLSNDRSTPLPSDR